ncbi:TPA: hypothetical protein LY620_000058 [Enterococcus faecium]|nr:hypothetical protein [Enterococcus faecium]
MLKKRIKYSALMMNLLMLSTPVLISVVEVAANEQQSVNEENAHVNIEGMSTMGKYQELVKIWIRKKEMIL